jgi:hypothetical protein
MLMMMMVVVVVVVVMMMYLLVYIPISLLLFVNLRNIQEVYLLRHNAA